MNEACSRIFGILFGSFFVWCGVVGWNAGDGGDAIFWGGFGVVIVVLSLFGNTDVRDTVTGSLEPDTPIHAPLARQDSVSPEERARREKEWAERLRQQQEERERKRKEEEERRAREGWATYHRFRPINEIDGMTGLQFELFVQMLMEKAGHKNVRTTPNNDQGADLLCETPEGKRAAVQTKRWKGVVGNGAIQEVLAAMIYYSRDVGYVFTNSRFTDSAKSLAAKHPGVVLVDRQTLVKMIEKHCPPEIPEFDWDEYNKQILHKPTVDPQGSSKGYTPSPVVDSVSPEETTQQWAERYARGQWECYWRYRWVHEKELDAQKGIRFMGFLQSLMQEAGYKNVRLKPINDDNAELLCETPEGRPAVVQMKRSSGRLGHRAIQEVLTAMRDNNCEVGYVFTNSFFTDSAHSLAQKKACIFLVDVQGLERMVEKYYPVQIPDFDWDKHRECQRQQQREIREKKKSR